MGHVHTCLDIVLMLYFLKILKMQNFHIMWGTSAPEHYDAGSNEMHISLSSYQFPIRFIEDAFSVCFLSYAPQLFQLAIIICFYQRTAVSEQILWMWVVSKAGRKLREQGGLCRQGLLPFADRLVVVLYLFCRFRSYPSLPKPDGNSWHYTQDLWSCGMVS